MAIQGFFPPTKPVASPTGLLNSDGVEVIHHSADTEGWINGPQDVELLSGAFQLYVSDYCSGNMDALVQTGTDVCKTWTYPFGVVATYPIEGAIGLPSDLMRERVVHAADVLTQKAIEHEFWSGQLAVDAGHLDAQYITGFGANDISPGGSATAADHALSALEYAIGVSDPGTGVIHMTRDVASRLSQYLRNENNKIYTILGTPVVVGSGYLSGSDGAPLLAPPSQAAYPPIPATASYTTSWMYATGPVVVHLGSVQYIGERRDIATNEVIAMAGRPAAVYWDNACHFAAEVNLSTAVG